MADVPDEPRPPGSGDPGPHEELPAEVSDYDPAHLGADELAAEIDDLDEELHEILEHAEHEHPEEAAGAPFVDGTPAPSDLVAERDEYLEALRRVKAEFENYKKRTDKEREAAVDKRVSSIVADLLPVLDACDAAVAHGDEGVAQIRALLVESLSKGGLEQLEPVGKPFDPNLHEAVLQEPGDGQSETVVEVMRSGYSWRGRVIRPAMVKVRT